MEPTEDGLVIISRKLTSARSISRINDETVTMARLSQITGLLLDIHGQHEHQSLLYKSKHLEILDAYVKAATQPVKQTIADRYRIYRSLEEKLRGFDLDAESRIREADFLRFEIEEIGPEGRGRGGAYLGLPPLFPFQAHCRVSGSRLRGSGGRMAFKGLKRGGAGGRVR